MIQAAPSWLAKGVDLADEVAASYAAEQASTDDDRLRLFGMMWRAGNAAGLAGIADVLATRARSASGNRNDFLNAYAHQLLYVRLSESARLTPLGPLSARLLRESSERLASLQRQLLPEQIALGAKRAAEVLQSNGAKCLPF
jgi:hypothetical protein